MIAALKAPLESLSARVETFTRPHDKLIQVPNDTDSIDGASVSGSFYSFANVSEVINRPSNVRDDITLTERILDEVDLALVPGSAFGAPEFVRISYAACTRSRRETMTQPDRFADSLAS